MMRGAIAIYSIIAYCTFGTMTAHAFEHNSENSTTTTQFSRPLNVGSIVEIDLQTNNDADIMVAGLMNGSPTTEEAQAIPAELLNWDRSGVLLLNRHGRAASNQRSFYDPEDEFWIFNDSFFASVNTRSGRVCTRTGNYRICHGR